MESKCDVLWRARVILNIGVQFRRCEKASEVPARRRPSLAVSAKETALKSSMLRLRSASHATVKAGGSSYVTAPACAASLGSTASARAASSLTHASAGALAQRSLTHRRTPHHAMAPARAASSLTHAPAAALVQHFLTHQPTPHHGAACPCCVRRASAATSPPVPGPSSTDYAFEFAASTTRFGVGATHEVGHDVKALGKKVMVFTDPYIASIPNGPLSRVLNSLARVGMAGESSVVVYDSVRVEPTDTSFAQAITAAKEARPDVYLAVGGGSVMDTAKAANLYASHPDAEFLDFVNAPIGAGKPVPGPVKPLIAVPTTAGTGSETTGVAIFDYEPLGAKTGIASRMLKPTLGIVDPENTASAPAPVAAAAGFDVLCHALESLTAIPFDHRSPRPATPALRPAYQGANPMSDVWSATALRLISRYFLRSVANRDDIEAHTGMALAASAAGVGFGNAGVHLCHAAAYGIAGLNKAYVHPGYGQTGSPLVPHGVAVALSAPAVFQHTAGTNVERHLLAARLLGGEDAPSPLDLYMPGRPPRPAASAVEAADAGARLADRIRALMAATGQPDGLAAVGYTAADIPSLVEVTLPQRRVLDIAPTAQTALATDARGTLGAIFEASLKLY